MVDFVRLHIPDDVRQIARTADVPVVQVQLHFVPVVGVPVDVVQTVGVEAAGATDDAMHFVALRKQKLGQVRAILAGDACYKCFLCHKLH